MEERDMTGIGNLGTGGEARAALFVDWSNIYIGRREAAQARGETSLEVRVSATRLAALMASGRPVAQGVAVVNATTTPSAAQRRIEEGFHVIRARPAVDG